MSKRSISRSRVILTGASSGIGCALARLLSRRGADMLLTARREERLAALAAELQTPTSQVLYRAGDITSPALRSTLIEVARTRWSGLDLLINNAGAGAALAPFREADESRLRRIMEVNFFAPAELMRAAVPLLRNGRRPMIVNVSSVLGHRAVPLKSEYCASKFALHGLSDAVRAELQSLGIDLLLVSPSTTRTEFFDAAQAGAEPVRPPRRAMTPEKVAQKIVRAVEQGRHEIILSGGGKLLVWLDRLSPPLMNRLIAHWSDS